MTAIELDQNGHLLDHQKWTRTIAETFASQDGLTLTPLHDELIDISRRFYDRYGRMPSPLVLVNLLREIYPLDTFSSLQLQQLFPKGVAKQLSKIAGLPKPIHCT